MSAILEVEQVSKKFCRDVRLSLSYGLRDMAKEVLGRDRRAATLRPREFWAVRDVSLSLKPGDAVGLVGQNGSGKTTLLRMISGLFKPDHGQIKIRGRVAPLLALGAGFNPVLSGRENIYVNLSILGLSNREIEGQYAAVVDFAEIGDAIESPVQTYSSGMAARLGFACAVHTRPDLLLVDEVLSVGDMRFRSKCYRKLAELRREGTAFVLVSHSPNSILTICSSAAYLNQGRMVMVGAPTEVMKRYEDDQAGLAEVEGSNAPVEKRDTFGIQRISFLDSSGQTIASPTCGQPTVLRVEFRAESAVRDVSLGLLIREMQTSAVDYVLNLASDRDGKTFELKPGLNFLDLNLPYCGLRPGAYIMKVLVNRPNLDMLDAVEHYRFKVEGIANMSQCAYYQPRTWG